MRPVLVFSILVIPAMALAQSAGNTSKPTKPNDDLVIIGAKPTPVRTQPIKKPAEEKTEPVVSKPESVEEKTQTPQLPPRALIPIHNIRNIFVAPMANDLDQYIKAELEKQMAKRVRVVLKVEDADAVLTGTGEWQKGPASAITGRWLGLHDTATGAVSLIGSDQSTVLWSSEAGDRSLLWGVLVRGGPRKVADRLVHNLKKAMHE